MKKLLLKIGIFLLLLALPQMLFSVILAKVYDDISDPRQRIFAKGDTTRYRCALLGDSVFVSCYVDNESETLWKQIEKMAGVPVLPAALTGARPYDIIDASVYLGHVLAPGSFVFIDALPGKDWTDNSRYYQNMFFGLMGDYDYRWHQVPLSRLYLTTFATLHSYKINPEDVKYLFNYFTKKKYFVADDCCDRVWYNDGFALKRFSSYDPDRIMFQFGRLDVAVEILLHARLKAVVVLTPLNKELIRSYGGTDKAAKMLARFAGCRSSLRSHLESRKIPYLDLTDAVTSEGFADMFHTNALGDAVIAREITSFMRQGGAPSR